ncbi:VENN motif pre-toxin domain-containing protein [Orbaceae bacterium ac157xtp]
MTDQSGIFAKEGGYNITVGNNTDLKGAVIASEAKDKANNKLDTGTISFSDIENKADYHVDAVSVSIGTSPTTPGMSYHKSDSDHSTTHSAVEDGELIIRDKENQKQSINDLSHDTANANNPLEQIFDKQEHLDNIEIIETINAISKETISIIDTANKAKAEKARQDEINKNLLAGEADKNENGYSQLTKEEQERYDEQLLANANKAGEEAYDQSLKGSSSAMGSDERKHLNALTNIAKGLITGDITGTIGGVSAPYLAEQIKKYTEGNSEIANKTLHAVLGAAVAKLQGNSAIAGGAGAVTGEVVADIICDKLYGKEVKDLTEAEKENISALTQLATGLATVASTGGDLNATGTAVAAGKNAVENNYLSSQDHQDKKALEYKERHGELTDKERLRLIELNIKDETSTDNLIVACVDVLSEACDVERQKAYNDLSTYRNLTYQYKKEDQAGYQEIDSLLQATSSSQEANMMRQIYHSYRNSYISLGYSEEEAGVMAGRTMSVQMIAHGVSGTINIPMINRIFGGSKLNISKNVAVNPNPNINVNKNQQKQHVAGANEVNSNTVQATDVKVIGAVEAEKGMTSPTSPVKVSIANDFTKSPQAIWGRSADDIAKDFQAAGYQVNIRQSSRGSGQAVIVEVIGHPEISQIQVHPGGGRHGGSYYKISTTTQGTIKVVDPITYKSSAGEKAIIIGKPKE